MVIVLYNYSAHKSKITKKFAKLLNIKLIFLPTPSPKLNPILCRNKTKNVYRKLDKKNIFSKIKSITIFYFIESKKNDLVI
ncbi:MAG: hypothetical protein KUA29_04050 [Methanobacterium sp.]|nr:hypothetical protein [Methanobacterium sp.]